ncbi:hypothetical protein RF11_16396 [Thelohanellus kitauei]|uniref:Uncharacterized protein n=1 Tax=Thelohanellus kitauei TaxID=669202 RepID=A0A0C2M9B5_THEKT|nr:hypothetical protein RF11_16396 [Thelohanellus kitauei]
MFKPAPVHYYTDFTSTTIAMLSTRDCTFQGRVPGRHQPAHRDSGSPRLTPAKQAMTPKQHLFAGKKGLVVLRVSNRSLSLVVGRRLKSLWFFNEIKVLVNCYNRNC